MDSGLSATAAGIHFPFEIWILILQFLCACGQEYAARAARIHPAFLDEAESILYREPRITSFQQAVQFANTLSQSVLRPRLAEAVRELHIVVSGQDYLRAPQYAHLLRGILDQLPRLIALRFRRMPLKSTDDFSWRFMVNHITLPILVADRQRPIKRLRGEFVPQSSQFSRFLLAQPELEEVWLDGSWVTGPGQPYETLELPKLYALGCDHRLAVHIQNPRNITHLYVVEDRSQAQMPMLPHIIRVFGAQLISLRVDLCLQMKPAAGLDYPTLRDYHWEDCPRLKFLHIDDGPLSSHRLRPPARPRNSYQYGVEERKEAKLPPALETFVWAPSWTRYSPSSDPQHGHRRAIQRFSEAVLKDFTSIREVIYVWMTEEYFHCSLLPMGEWWERRTDPREADDDAWAVVR